MKDTRGVVIYVGKSRFHLPRSRRFLLLFPPPTWEPPRQATPSGIRRRLRHPPLRFGSRSPPHRKHAFIKDVQPPLQRLACSMIKPIPYLEITTRDDYPGVYNITRTPSNTGTKLYGPFTEPPSLLRDAIQHLQARLQIPHLPSGNP